MPATEILLMERVAQIADAEFTPEGLVTEFDRLGRSAGFDGRDRMAVSVERAAERAGQVMVLEPEATLQLYLSYDATPDSTIAVDPRVIAAYADRLRAAFRQNSSGTTGDLWYVRLTRVEYPDDPTGNKSRLEATILANGNNTAAMPV